MYYNAFFTKSEEQNCVNLMLFPRKIDKEASTYRKKNLRTATNSGQTFAILLIKQFDISVFEYKFDHNKLVAKSVAMHLFYRSSCHVFSSRTSQNQHQIIRFFRFCF